MKNGSSSPMLQISNLVKDYGTFRAVNDISITIERGEIFGFLGVNGAGKTTTLKMLAGVLKPSSGTIFIDGIDLAKDPISAKRITGYIPDRPYLYAKLSAREFLVFVSELYEVEKNEAKRKIDQLLEEYSLTDWQHELIESFSHGMKQRLATCAALIHSPRLLIVDEPMVGLDPHGAKFLKESFKRYAKEGMSILLSTHSLNVAEELADRLAIIQRGEILTTGTIREVKERAGAHDVGLEEVFLRLTASQTL